MLSIRAGTLPSFLKPWEVPGGTRRKVPGEANAFSSPKKNVISPSRM